MTPIAPHITAFLRERLTCENTRATYAYTFQLLFAFASKRLGVAPSDLQVEQIDTGLVLAFLDHIQHERSNGARTRNTRLAAIRSFMRFLEYRVPAALDQIRCVLAIPVQRADTRLVKHLSAAESRALLNAPDRTRSTNPCAAQPPLEPTPVRAGSRPGSAPRGARSRQLPGEAPGHERRVVIA